MGIVTSTIYATTASEAMTQLEFSTDFQGENATVTIDLVQSGDKVTTKTYNLTADQPTLKISLEGSKINSDGTITLAAKGNAIAFSGVCVWQNVTSFFAQNVAVAYR